MTANTATAPPKAARAETQWAASGCRWPPWGWAAVRNTASAAQVTSAAVHAPLGDVLVDPEPAEDQGEDQFGDEEGLDDRELPAVKCDRLEGKSPCRRHPTEEPQRLADQEADEIPATVFDGHTDAGRVLGHEVYRVASAAARAKTIVTVTSQLQIEFCLRFPLFRKLRIDEDCDRAESYFTRCPKFHVGDADTSIEDVTSCVLTPVPCQPGPGPLRDEFLLPVDLFRSRQIADPGPGRFASDNRQDHRLASYVICTDSPGRERLRRVIASRRI